MSKHNALRMVFLMLALVAYSRPSQAWPVCDNRCSGSTRIIECAYFGEQVDDCEELYWELEYECTQQAVVAGGGAASFQLNYCSEEWGEYSTYCSFNDNTCNQ